jgi:hypothetical protein
LKQKKRYPFEERPYKQTIYYRLAAFAEHRSQLELLRNIKYACPECRKEALAGTR